MFDLRPTSYKLIKSTEVVNKTWSSVGFGYPHRSYFGFSFERQYYVFNVLCFGYSPAPDHFQHLMSDVCRILHSQGVPCNVELDDVIICGEGRERSLRATHLAISILEQAGFKINYSKSVISPTQLIDYLGYTLDARNQCFCLQKSKLVKCKLILKGLSILNSVSRKLMEQLTGPKRRCQIYLLEKCIPMH